MRPNRGRPVACHGCREQKIRCDLTQYGQDAACSRCIRIGFECLKTSPVTWKRNRKTKAAMQRELDHLRQQLSQGRADASLVHEEPPTVLADPWQDLGDSHLNPVPLLQMTPTNQDHAYSAFPGPNSSSAEDGHPFSSASLSLEGHIRSRRPSAMSRVLDGREYDAQRIDDCFDLYFEFYHPLFPVLDPTVSPDDFYAQSPFLFWTILVTGCRRYAHDPTMLESIGPHINGMAFASMSSRLAQIQTLQGLLILCVWAVPLKSMTRDVTYLISGAAMNIAMQNGLHISGGWQDFERNQLPSDDRETTFRDRLWSFTFIVCQVTSQSLGLPPPAAVDFVNMNLRGRSHPRADEVQFFYDVTQTQGRAVAAFMRQASCSAGGVKSPVNVDNTLHVLIKSYDAELNSFAPRLSNERRILHLNIARLHVNSFLFLTTDDTQALDHDGLVELYYLAYKVIIGMKVSYLGNMKSSRPDYANWSKLLAAFIILKISRSCLAGRVDLRAGEKAYFATILGFRESSFANDDLPARGATVLGQLWSSTRVFRRPDGVVDGLALRVRSRLSMAIVHDCFCRWKEEFQGKEIPYTAAQSVSASKGMPFFQSSDVVSLPSNPASTPRQEIFNEIDTPQDLTGTPSLEFTMPDNMAFDI